MVANTTSASSATEPDEPREGLNAAHSMSTALIEATNAKSSRNPGCADGTTSERSHAASTATSVPASAYPARASIEPLASFPADSPSCRMLRSVRLRLQSARLPPFLRFAVDRIVGSHPDDDDAHSMLGSLQLVHDADAV